MCAPMVVIIEIARKRILEVSFIQYDDLIQALPSNRADDSLRVRVLPGTPGSNQHFINSHTVHPLLKVVPVHLVPIAKKILGCRVVWKGLHDLLGGPLGRWVLGHIEMEDSAPMMGKDHQDEEHLESHRWYDEKVDGYQVMEVIFQTCPPGWGGWIGGANAVLVYRGLGNLNSEFSELADNSGRAPAGIGFGDSPNQIADFFGDCRAAWFTALAEPSPVIAKPALLPFGDGPWLHEDQKRHPPPVYPGDTGPQNSIGGSHPGPVACPLIDR